MSVRKTCSERNETSDHFNSSFIKRCLSEAWGVPALHRLCLAINLLNLEVHRGKAGHCVLHVALYIGTCALVNCILPPSNDFQTVWGRTPRGPSHVVWKRLNIPTEQTACEVICFSAGQEMPPFLWKPSAPEPPHGVFRMFNISWRALAQLAEVLSHSTGGFGFDSR